MRSTQAAFGVGVGHQADFRLSLGSPGQLLHGAPQPPFSGPFYRWQPCRLGVLRATGTSGYGHRSLRKQVWSLSTASNAFFAHPSASKENTPRKSQAGRGHGCCSPYKPIIYQPPAATFSPESGLEPWKEAGYQSSPSTPLPLLPPEAWGGPLLFGEATLRKRALFRSCSSAVEELWEGAEHSIRDAETHLPGDRQSQSRVMGRRNFYYTKLDVGMDMLTDSSALQLFYRYATVTKPTSKSCLAPIHLEPQPTEAQAYIPALPAKLGANLRKPWGDAKKYGKVYGMDHRGLWYTACCWKNACQHFLD